MKKVFAYLGNIKCNEAQFVKKLFSSRRVDLLSLMKLYINSPDNEQVATLALIRKREFPDMRVQIQWNKSVFAKIRPDMRGSTVYVINSVTVGIPETR